MFEQSPRREQMGRFLKVNRDLAQNVLFCKCQLNINLIFNRTENGVVFWVGKSTQAPIED